MHEEIDISAIQADMENLEYAEEPVNTASPEADVYYDSDFSEDDMDFPWEDLLEFTNGRDSVGNPFAAGVLAIDQMVDQTHTKTIRNVYLKDGEFQVRISGGCAAMYIDMPRTSRMEFDLARQLCDEWFENLDNPDCDDQIFTLTVTPLLLEGAVFLVFNHMVLADCRETKEGYRMILAFDNLQTTPVANSDVDFRQLMVEIEAEFKRQENELLDSIEEAHKIEAESQYNPFDEMYKEQIESNTLFKKPESIREEKKENNGIRVVKEEQDENFNG